MWPFIKSIARKVSAEGPYREGIEDPDVWDPFEIFCFQLACLLTDIKDISSIRDVFPSDPVDKRDDPTNPYDLNDISSQIELIAIEVRLAKHLDAILNLPEGKDQLLAVIRGAIGNPQNIDVVEKFSVEMGVPDLAKRMFLFSPFWVRSPQSWNQDSELGLLEHLFVQYEVPPFLVSAWVLEPDVTIFKWVSWFILLGQGASLKRAAPIFGWVVPRGFTRHLWGVSASIPPVEACSTALVRWMGGGEIAVQRVRPSFCWAERFTDGGPHGNAISMAMLRWMIDHASDITDDQCELILGWMFHGRDEARPVGAPDFSLKTLRVGTAIRRATEYRQAIDNLGFGEKLSWKGHGWDWHHIDGSDDEWLFSELTTSDGLIEEGRILSHCVGTYARACVTGSSAIVSVRKNGMPTLTIEVNPRSNRIVQVRGVSNQPSTNAQRRVVDLWATRFF
ncbi:MAG TPA: hypothetical protein EYO58_07145 [Flavobacteriales bacterium]|nr:hypothetical protein [Flavobacteriales bacterium]